VERVDGLQEDQEFLTRLLESKPAGIPPAHSKEEMK